MTPDLGHLLLSGLIGVVIYFLQRELNRNDKLREETIALVKNCNEKLEAHEVRITTHGTKHQLLEQRVAYLEKEVEAVRQEHDRLARAGA